MGYLLIRAEDILRIHLSEISVLILESTAISMTAVLLSECAKRKIKIVFCDENHDPYGELMQYYASYDSSRGIRLQINWPDDLKQRIWQEIIKDKIHKQALILEQLGHHENCKLLSSYISEVQPGDQSNREGHAAKVYFNSLFGKGFSREQEDPINAALDYGYAILLAVFNREVVAQGRITQLGIWHSSIFNFFNLSSDLMEVFRPLVDRKVANFRFIKGEFTKEHRHELITLLESEIIVNGMTYKLNTAIRIYVMKIIKALDERDLTQIPVLTYV